MELYNVGSVFDSDKECELGFRASPDKNPSGGDNSAANDDRLHQELQNLDLKEKEGEAEKKDFGVDDDKAEGKCNDNRNGKSEVSHGDGRNEGSENVNNWGWDDYEKDDGKNRESDRDGDRGNEHVNDWDWDHYEEEKVGGDGYGEVEERNERDVTASHEYPIRPEAEDCAFYLKTGTCKFGSNCRFNHLVRRRSHVRDKEDSLEKPSLGECKFYSKTGSCKFGSACRYIHTRSNSTSKVSAPPILKLNFLGLPVRPDEKECPYYMRTGSCKYGTSCRFNHPDPTAVGATDTPPGNGNGGSLSVNGMSRLPITSWSSPRNSNEPTLYIPTMFSTSQRVPPQKSEWNGYQAPMYPSERNVLPTQEYVMNNPATEPTVYKHRHQQMQVEEYPERPGQPECTHFLKTGDCKFKSNCKYHHPKNSIMIPAPFTLSDRGLPLRPDQNICTHYSRYGICKFGPACKYDHPIEGAEMTQPGSGNNAKIHHSVTTL